ncbi:MAG TPA: type II CAAX endopeptidase family protein [Myxococcaceae bacterium]|nr:type II CAAX endopeptidase family protein [Myxococcaceae bacterium]
MSALGRLRSLVRDLGGEPALVLCGASAVLVVSHYQGSTSGFSNLLGARFAQSPARDALPYFWWYGCSVVLYAAIPLTLSAMTRGRFTRKYGLGLGDARAGLAWAGVLLAVMLPAVFIASRTRFFQGAYPLAGSGAFTLKPVGAPEHRSYALFAAYEAAYLAYFVAWEFLFRGWLLNGLLPRFGRGAILIQTVPFAIMHLGKPEPEALGSIIAGVALGILALRTRSMWYGALVHGAVAFFMDAVATTGPFH